MTRKATSFLLLTLSIFVYSSCIGHGSEEKKRDPNDKEVFPKQGLTKEELLKRRDLLLNRLEGLRGIGLLHYFDGRPFVVANPQDSSKTKVLETFGLAELKASGIESMRYPTDKELEAELWNMTVREREHTYDYMAEEYIRFGKHRTRAYLYVKRPSGKEYFLPAKGLVLVGEGNLIFFEPGLQFLEQRMAQFNNYALINIPDKGIVCINSADQMPPTEKRLLVRDSQTGGVLFKKLENATDQEFGTAENTVDVVVIRGADGILAEYSVEYAQGALAFREKTKHALAIIHPLIKDYRQSLVIEQTSDDRFNCVRIINQPITLEARLLDVSMRVTVTLSPGTYILVKPKAVLKLTKELTATDIEATVVPQKGLKLVTPRTITEVRFELGIEIEGTTYANTGTVDKPVKGPVTATYLVTGINPYTGEAEKEVTLWRNYANKEIERKERHIFGILGRLGRILNLTNDEAQEVVYGGKGEQFGTHVFALFSPEFP